MTEIIIIRHGETEWNITGRFQGHSDVPLSAAGHEQAELLGKNIALDDIDKIYASDLIRAVETAQPLAAFPLGKGDKFVQPLFRHMGRTLFQRNQ